MTQVELCNVALAHLGEARIAAINDDTVTARACALHYGPTRTEVLRSHRWNFAIARAQLTAATAPAFGWARAFNLPTDCLRALEVNDNEVGDVISEAWAIEGRQVLTNAEAVRLVYVKDIGDTALTDPLFAAAFGLKLAAVLSETIRGSTGKTAELLQLYDARTAPLARRIDANEGRRRKGLLSLNSFLVRARGEWRGNGRLRPW